MKKWQDFVNWGFCAMLLAIFTWIGAEIRGTRGELIEIGKAMSAVSVQVMNHEDRIKYLEHR